MTPHNEWFTTFRLGNFGFVYVDDEKEYVLSLEWDKLKFPWTMLA